MNSGKSIMRKCNSLEVSKKAEIRLFSLPCRIGFTSGRLSISTGGKSLALNPAKVEGVLRLRSLPLKSKQDTKRSFFERAIKSVFEQNTVALEVR